MTEPDAAVWVADGAVTDELDYGDRLVERLAASGRSVVRRDPTSVDASIPPARLHVLSGGATSVTDQSGWMPGGLARTRRLVDAARQGGPVVVGICLGAQMIVESVCPGGIRGSKRIEAGLTEIEWSLEENGSLVVPAFHYEEIDWSTIIAGGGEVVASNAHSPVQGFRFGGRVWGFQFHPELDPTDVRRLVHHHRRTITTYGGDITHALRSVDQFESRWSEDSFDQLLKIINASIG